MTVHTIDLSGILPDISVNLVKLKYDYDQDREVRSKLFGQYWVQKRLSDDLFGNWLAQTNAGLIKDVDKFIRHSLGIDGQKDLFQGSHSNLIHPATVILGMQATDHKPTLDMIEKHICKEHPTIKTLRVKSKLAKKKQLIEFYNSRFVQRDMIVIVEQTEIIDKHLLEMLVSGLYERLHLKLSDHIMVMFCMSGSWKPINHLFPIGIMNRMKKSTTIVKDTTIIFDDIQRRLLQNDELTFKLDPAMIRLIDNEFLERDASIMNIKYLYQYALFEHHIDRASLLTLPRKDLVNILNSHPKLFSDMKNLDSLSIEKNVQSMNQTVFAGFCVEQVEQILNYHRFLVDQVFLYYMLLRDETQEVFPSTLLDIYQIVFDFDDLAKSPEFFDAVNKVSQFSVEGLQRRILKIQEKRSRSKPRKKNGKDLYDILTNFLEILENNSDTNVIISKLVNELLQHSRIIRNPLGPLNESVYHYKCRQVQKRTTPATVSEAMNDYVDTTYHYGNLYQMINVGPEEMNMSILFGDFKDNFKHSKCESESPRKKTRTSEKNRTRPSQTNENNNSLEAIEPTLDDGLVKAIFVDLIDCMEHQGLIKLDKRQSNKGILRKNVWL